MVSIGLQDRLNDIIFGFIVSASKTFGVCIPRTVWESLQRMSQFCSVQFYFETK